MKKVSDTVLRRLNEIEPENLIGIVERVDKPKLEFICPNCGNGGGANKTGIEPYRAADNHIGYHCTKCDAIFNNVKLVRKAQGVSFVEACKLLAPIAGINESDIFGEGDGDGEYHARQRAPEVAAELRVEPEHDTTAQINHDTHQSVEPERDGEREKIAAVIRDELTNADNKKILENFCENCGGKWRGIDIKILRRHNCVMSLMWQSPKSKLDGKSYAPSKRILIPCDESLTSYLARATEDNAAPKIHCGSKKLFFSEKAALNGGSPVFIVEGAVDAMSIEQTGFKAVALGGIAGGNLLIDFLKKNAVRPKIILLFDGDKSGRDAAPKLLSELKKINVPCVMKFLQLDGEGDKVDANEILENQGVEVLQRRLREIFDSALPELERLDKKVDAQIKTDASDAARDETRSVDTVKGIEDSRKATPKDIGNELTPEEIDALYSGDKSDLDFSRRLEIFCGRRYRWLDDEQYWLKYDGKIWRKASPKNSSVSPEVVKLHDLMVANARDDTELKLARTIKQTAKVMSVVNMFKSHVNISSADLDNHPELLNFQNGTVDLTTGKFFEHDANNLLTQICLANYNPNAAARKDVEKIFRDVMPNEETAAGLKRFLGYCVTSSVAEEKFAIITGKGGTGKSTITNFLLKLLNKTYGNAVGNSVFIKNKPSRAAGVATTDINALINSRVVVSSELDENAVLDAAVVKNLSGGDLLKFRLLHHEEIAVEPTAKIIISSNFLPRFDSRDSGIIRRLLNFDFAVEFGKKGMPPRDPMLKRKLESPEYLDGLAAILVAEAVEWYKAVTLTKDGKKSSTGLIVSPEMQDATDRAIGDSDYIQEFLSDTDIFVINPSATVRVHDVLDKLREKYSRQVSGKTDKQLTAAIIETKLMKNTGDGGEEEVKISVERGKYKMFRGIGLYGTERE